MALLEKIAGPPIRKPDFQHVIFLINHADFLFCYLISTVLCENDKLFQRLPHLTCYFGLNITTEEECI